MKRLRYVFLALAMACGACGSDGAGTPQTHDMPKGTCADEASHNHPTLMEYSSGISQDGERGVTVAITESDPAPPRVGDNVWTLLVEVDGEPTPGLKLKLNPFQVDHGHSTPSTPRVVDQGDGVYVVNPVNLSMSGFWNTEIRVQSDTVTDSVNFGFCAE